MIKGIGEFGVKRRCLVESNFKMILGRRNFGNENSCEGFV